MANGRLQVGTDLLALLERSALPLPKGTKLARLQDDLVNLVAYLGDETLHRFDHADEALEELICGFYAGRLAPSSPAAQQCEGPTAAAKTLSEAEAAAASVQAERPERYALEPNYPNPFNPQTTIRYALPEEAHVRVVVYDLLGRELATLVDQEQGAGIYEVAYDGSGLSSGLYVYVLEAGAFRAVGRMVLVK
jgi:hypothetical protein